MYARCRYSVLLPCASATHCMAPLSEVRECVCISCAANIIHHAVHCDVYGAATPTTTVPSRPVTILSDFSQFARTQNVSMTMVHIREI